MWIDLIFAFELWMTAAPAVKSHCRTMCCALILLKQLAQHGQNAYSPITVSVVIWLTTFLIYWDNDTYLDHIVRYSVLVWPARCKCSAINLSLSAALFLFSLHIFLEFKFDVIVLEILHDALYLCVVFVYYLAMLGVLTGIDQWGSKTSLAISD